MSSLLRGSSTRGARGPSSNRSRGTRGGRGSSRGGPTSSNSSLSANTPNGFDQERLENAAKREQRGRGYNGMVANGRGTYPKGNNQVRFNNNPTALKKDIASSNSPSPPAMNLFAPPQSSSLGTLPSAPFSNPFATATPPAFNPFGSTDSSNTFGSQAQTPTTQNPFTRTSPPGTSTSKPTSAFFGAPSATPSNPFVGAQSQPNSVLANTLGSQSQFASNASSAQSMGISSNSFGGTQSQKNGTPGNSFGMPTNPSGFASTASVASTSRAKNHGFAPTSKPTAQSLAPQTPFPPVGPSSSTTLGTKIDQLLQKEGIYAPAWPTSTPGDPQQKGAIEAFWQTSKKYRNKVRATLIRAGFLDDPDKPKKLSEAIDFKGTCEEMCPEFEKITRIMEHDVREPEKDPAPDGTLWPSPPKMIKALARSAAGQDAPLPMDVRSPAALRRTLDYLLHTVLGHEEGRLPIVHGFLWDRTRAIRRDFVFQSSMSPTELVDQVYCLERITRFHVIALHQMSMEGIEADDFSEQQEVEQLGKSLLSLIHAYEDCQGQGVACENEPEFRAYYVLFNSHNTGILETVQDWGWKFWGESEDIKIAVSLVEALQNTWDTRGPLKPHFATDVAQNAFARFFTIIEDKKVSYTMACFAEIHFNNVRKSALKAIFAAYRLQRPRTKDWTLDRLNAYLRFDDESDIISFATKYNLRFEDAAGENYLSFESEEPISDPFPPLKQSHSYSLVERKRGCYTLPQVMDSTVYDENNSDEEVIDGIGEEVEDGEGLFVTNSGVGYNERALTAQPQMFIPNETAAGEQQPTTRERPAPAPESISQPTSIFDQISIPRTSSFNFSMPKAAETTIPDQQIVETSNGSTSTRPQGNGIPSIISTPLIQNSGQSEPFFHIPQQTSTPPVQMSLSSAPQSPTANATSSESFKPLFSQGSHMVSTPPIVPAIPLSGSPTPSFNLGSYSVTTPTPTENPKPQSFLGNQPVHSPSLPSFGGIPITKDHLFASPHSTTQSSLEQSASGIGPTRKEAVSLEPQTLFGASSGSVSQTNPPPATDASTATDKSCRLQDFANWIAMGEGGLFEQFTAHAVGELLHEAMAIHDEEETVRIATEAEEMARKQADDFRYHFLATKYSQKWRTLAYQIWLRRKGKQAREARREFARSQRASKAAQEGDVVDDFKASTTNTRRNSLESLLDATGVLNGVHNSDEQVRAIARNQPPRSSRKQQASTHSSISLGSTTSKHKRGKSDNPLRRSLLSDPSYLTGGSRIHLMSNYTAKDETRKRTSGVQTDYFRLKARGITTLPDGTPLASTVANDILRQKRSFDQVTKVSTPTPSRKQDIPRSAPNFTHVPSHGRRDITEREEDIQTLKVRAKVLMANETVVRQSKPKRSFDGDDEELFERAKRVREQLDEGAGWYRKQIDRDTASRSVS